MPAQDGVQRPRVRRKADATERREQPPCHPVANEPADRIVVLRERERLAAVGAPVRIGHGDQGHAGERRAGSERDPEVPDHDVGADRGDDRPILVDIPGQRAGVVHRQARGEPLEEHPGGE
jgi:hypothetical protein